MLLLTPPSAPRGPPSAHLTPTVPPPSFQIIISSASAKPIGVKLAHEGIFGQAALLGRRREATAMARTQCEAMLVSREDLQKLFEADVMQARRMCALVLGDFLRMDRLRMLALRLRMLSAHPKTLERAALTVQVRHLAESSPFQPFQPLSSLTNNSRALSHLDTRRVAYACFPHDTVPLAALQRQAREGQRPNLRPPRAGHEREGALREGHLAEARPAEGADVGSAQQGRSELRSRWRETEPQADDDEEPRVGRDGHQDL